MNRCLMPAIFLLGTVTASEVHHDAKPLQGTWVIGAATLAGRDHGEDFRGMKLIIAGDRFTIEFGQNSDKGTFITDTARTPKRIDIKTSATGPFKGKTLPGVYEVKGDKLTLCLEGDGVAGKRPTKFEAPESTRNMLLHFHREKK